MGMLFAKSKILMDRDGADLEDEFGIYDVPPALKIQLEVCLLYTSPSPRDATLSRMPSSA